MTPNTRRVLHYIGKELPNLTTHLGNLVLYFNEVYLHTLQRWWGGATTPIDLQNVPRMITSIETILNTAKNAVPNGTLRIYIGTMNGAQVSPVMVLKL